MSNVCCQRATHSLFLGIAQGAQGRHREVEKTMFVVRGSIHDDTGTYRRKKKHRRRSESGAVIFIGEGECPSRDSRTGFVGPPFVRTPVSTPDGAGSWTPHYVVIHHGSYQRVESFSFFVACLSTEGIPLFLQSLTA